ncbi:HAMP domain-containing protein [Paenibacillus rhizovicinus]|uniref:HAMP domain-containing protein n=1 Tax=Paenibacillus rhizovicinus TaxID=2704463 RepID=A0A6C0NYS5_9BACL|nr:sensor histidine kinase [Paenibacillus rhizovicinus]QHW31385.1 HAMP domain-containing protein [Paenibacillus rhizovicinus]
MMRTKTLGSRLVILFAAVTVPLLLMLYLAGDYAKKVVLTQVANSYQNLVNSNLNMIDRSLDDITLNMVDIVNHDDNFRLFEQPGLSGSDSYFAEMELIKRNDYYQSYYHTVDMFFVYSKPNDQLVSTNLTGEAAPYYEVVRQWLTDSFSHADSLKKAMYKWSVIHIADQYFLYRIVSDDDTNNAYIGALININSLRTPLGNLDLREGGGILFTGDDGTVLSNPAAPLDKLKRLPAERLSKNRAFTYANGKTKLLIVSSRSRNVGVHTAVVIPNSELLRGLDAFQTLTYLLPLIVLAILIVYGFIFRSLIFTPILQLLGAIRRIKEGNMSTRLPASGTVEFNIINHTFNGMVEEIVDLKIGVYEERLRAQKAQMKQLQLQINPHFFLNTMNIIFQLVDLKRYELVKKTVRHLVQYFRFMMGVKRDTITLEEEMAHIRNYLEIQKMRYQESFIYSIDIPETLKALRLPSLFVQPFVENAMIHGMSLQNMPFRLDIAATKLDGSEEGILIEVRDNGKGLSEEKLQELNAVHYAPESEDGSIGIWNVKQRMAMHYGDKARMAVLANEPRGTIVRLLLPAASAEEGSERDV